MVRALISDGRARRSIVTGVGIARAQCRDVGRGSGRQIAARDRKAPTESTLVDPLFPAPSLHFAIHRKGRRRSCRTMIVVGPRQRSGYSGTSQGSRWAPCSNPPQRLHSPGSIGRPKVGSQVERTRVRIQLLYPADMRMTKTTVTRSSNGGTVATGVASRWRARPSGAGTRLWQSPVTAGSPSAW
jgi:hypothetical protein